MKKIVALVDYQGRFGTKYFPRIYRSGMDKEELVRQFSNMDYSLSYCEMNLVNAYKYVQIPVIYTSQEDNLLRYKDFIEDIILELELYGAITLPPQRFLRATNNKVFMEILRRRLLPEKYQLRTFIFGSIEELIYSLDMIEYPCILKTASGSVSRGVHMAVTRYQILEIAKNISRTTDLKFELRDLARAWKYSGYHRESRYRGKFIIQNYIPGVFNDWKVLVYYDKLFVLRRQNRPGDFRASGSGLFSFDNVVDSRLLDAGIEIRKALDIPMVSLDLAIKEDSVVLFEFQGVHFGTSTLEKSPYYYKKCNEEWQQISGKSILEEAYAYSIVSYLEKGN